ncbi:hypothetical protein M1D72_10485 [Vibrio sp. AK197]
MNSSISAPTDNIAKFFAIFGLILLITTLTLSVYSYTNLKERAYSRYIELASLESIEKPTQKQLATIKVLNTQKETDTSDRMFTLKAAAVFLVISVFSIGFGFSFWGFMVQPQQNKLLSAQIRKTQLEAQILEQELINLTKKNEES